VNPEAERTIAESLAAPGWEIRAAPAVDLVLNLYVDPERPSTS
jgi:hypothetical protein